MTENGLTEPKSSQRLLAPLYGLLAASIVRLVVDAWEHPQPLRTVAAGLPEPIRAKAGDGLYWQLLSVFERACETLYLIGVGVPANADFTPVGPHILKVDGENVAAFVERRVTLAEYEMPSFDEVLATFIGCAGHFGHINIGRSEFAVHDDVSDVMKCLSKNGFAEKHGKKYSWTDGAGPAMQLCGCWDEDNKLVSHGGHHKKRLRLLSSAFAAAPTPSSAHRAPSPARGRRG